MDNAQLSVELEADGRRKVGWLDFRDFDTISNADDALTNFNPMFPLKMRVIQVLQIQHARGSLDITKLRVKLEDSGRMKTCWLGYREFAEIVGARQALTAFSEKS